MKDHTVASVGLYRPKPAYFRLDVAPFFLAYGCLHAGAWAETTAPFWVLAVFPIVLFAHALTHLSTHWSVDCLALVAFTKVKTVSQATHALVKPAPNSGSEEMVELVFHQGQAYPQPLVVAGTVHKFPHCHFEFQKTTFCFWEAGAPASGFERLHYPMQGKVKDLLSCKGYSKDDEVCQGLDLWGPNIFDIPLPAFTELFKEHAIAPFFLFQVLCVLLWSLDEYWYYSLFTLVLLVIFEGTVCIHRRRSLEMLRSMRRPAYTVYVYRKGKWGLISSEAILPGDVISLGKMNTSPEGGSGGGSRGKAGRRGEAKSAMADFGSLDNVMGSTADRLVPCDVVLLRGSCIVNEAMLTGESSPQMKEAIEIDAGNTSATFSLGAGVSGDAEVRSHVVFGGTKIIQLSYSKSAQASGSAESTNEATASEALVSVSRPPDKGCIALVLRTGFETSQGQLMRTILFATKRVTAGDAETALFIAILLVFAVIASAFVLQEGLKDETRNRFKLLLHCIMIVTSVVPPELPMELSLAVTNSLAALSRSLIYCTEPFRIPYAGKISVCCFDKTGTLTSDDLVLQGVVAPYGSAPTSSTEAIEDIIPSSALGGPTLWVMATCQSLMNVDGKVVGDPMERAVVEGIGWIIVPGNDSVLPPKRGPADFVPFRILHRYPFSSALRRMSVLVAKAGDSQGAASEAFIMSKGAPEALQSLLKEAPPHYTDTYLHHMSRGRRVLALAYRPLDQNMDLRGIRQMAREEAERSLIFVGFLIVDCPLKRDSRQVITELHESNHRTVMITGDSALTAADVARQLDMISTGPEETLHLVSTGGADQGSKPANGDGEFGLGWLPLVGGQRRVPAKPMPFTIRGLPQLAKKYSLCLEGDSLLALLHACGGEKGIEAEDEPAEEEGQGGTKRLVLSWRGRKVLSQVAPHVTVFARVAPDHKELLIAALNDAGEVTLMCGDGTNDVGALKKAHVGVSIINSPVLEKRADSLSVHYEKKIEERNRANNKSGTGTPVGVDPAEKQRNAQLAQMLAELREQENDPAIVQLGDASIASPFTAKRTSVACVISVVRQGRCTLVTTLQVYKILALNCLVSAYMLSTLYLFGVKQGDLQLTVVGVAIAGLFFFVSRAEPLEKLSPERPPSRIFCPQVTVSIVLQFVVHLACLVMTVDMCRPYVRAEDPSLAPDGPFHPNIINTAIFLLAGTMQVNTFTANYRGHPFMQSLTENVAMGRTALGLVAFLFLLASELIPPLNHMLQLVPFPTVDFRLRLVGLLLADTVLVHVIDRVCLVLFRT